jgi:Uncharacterized copper-binding protein
MKYWTSALPQQRLPSAVTPSLMVMSTRPLGSSFQFACLPPGHFEAGMVGKAVVK